MRIDLHLHTTHSDGVLATEALLRAVALAGLDRFAIADHDTLAAYDVDAAALAPHATRLISGIELSTSLAGTDIHILGYNVFPESASLKSLLTDRASARFQRAERIVAKLNAAGCSVSMEDVLRHARTGSIGRPHIVRALIERGYARDVDDAFARYLGSSAVAYVPSSAVSPAHAIAAIQRGGGVAVLAHPARNNVGEFLPELLASGLDGIEVYSPAHSHHDEARFRALARRHGLVITAGSDFHGPTEARPRPGVDIDDEEFASFLELLQRRASTVNDARTTD